MTDDVEGRFYRFLERSQEADPNWNRCVLEHYVPLFARCSHVLDVGCGEGQFLRLLKEQDIHATGVDRDPQMVERCHAQDLDVVQEDAFSYLARHQAAFDGVFSSNLIEHLCAADVLRFLNLCYDSLQPGGLLVVATPNATSAIVQLYEFWRDATHVRLYSPALVRFLLDYAGFESVRTGENPVTSWSPPLDIQNMAAKMDHLIPPSDPGHRPPLAVLDLPSNVPQGLFRGLVVRLRRAVARFLARTVLFEEFSAVERGLAALRTELESERSSLTATTSLVQQMGGVFHRTYAELLVTPREVWASGTKPARDTQEAP